MGFECGLYPRISPLASRLFQPLATSARRQQRQVSESAFVKKQTGASCVGFGLGDGLSLVASSFIWLASFFAEVFRSEDRKEFKNIAQRSGLGTMEFNSWRRSCDCS
jgi:hypothetical protein